MQNFEFAKTTKGRMSESTVAGRTFGSTALKEAESFAEIREPLPCGRIPSTSSCATGIGSIESIGSNESPSANSKMERYSRYQVYYYGTPAEKETAK